MPRAAGVTVETGRVTGRFAPSPTGPLHVGNLRTALLAWLAARSSGSPFTVRMEDLDRVTSSVVMEGVQLDELSTVGLDWDGPVVRQSARFDRYETALASLRAEGVLYECFCTRREVREAAAAPHGEVPRYPGTCRTLSAARRAQLEGDGRRAAWRVRADGEEITVVDRLHGTFTAAVDDVVVRRNDGVPAYHLAVVVDDADQGVAEVVRGDDLLAVTPAQVWLQHRLGLPSPAYAHVPLVVGADGTRLAKRDGAITLEDLAGRGVAPSDVLTRLAGSLGLLDPGASVGAAAELIESFDWALVPRRPCPVTELLATASQP